MHIKKKLFSMMFLTMLILTAVMKNSAVAQPSTIVSVINPLTGKSDFIIFYTNITSVSFRFNATVWVTDVVDLFAYQVTMYYNSTTINATRAWLPEWDTQWVFYGGAFLLNPVFESDYVQIGSTLFKGNNTFSGTGLLAVIEFEIIRYPPVSTYLEIDTPDTFLLDSSAVNDISASKINGYYEYKWPPPLPWLEVTPTLVEYGPSPSIGKYFNITVWLKGLDAAWKLVNITFGLTYNSTLIQALNATEGPFLKGFGNTKFFKSIGTNRLNVTNALDGLPTIYPNGEGAIATIKFNVTYQGTTKESKESPLILVGMKLISQDGWEISLDSTKIVDSVLYRIKSLTLSTINLIVAPTTVKVGSNVTITGAITPPLAEVNVTIYYKLDGENWTTLKIVKTNSDGSYTYDWKITETGSYQLKASWLGDTNTLPAESDVKNVKVETHPVDILPYILIATIISLVVAIGIYYWKIRKPRWR